MEDLKNEINDIEELAALIKDLTLKEKEAIKNIIIGVKLARDC